MNDASKLVSKITMDMIEGEDNKSPSHKRGIIYGMSESERYKQMCRKQEE